MKTELALTSDQPLAVAPKSQPTTADLIAAVIQGGVTESSVSVVERLVALKEREQKAEAERSFADAFASLQAEMPKIVARKIVPGNKEGEVRYTYAPYEDIMRQAQPFIAKFGFSITFDTKIEDTRVNVTCTLLHRGGHYRSNQFAARIGKGPPGSSEAQGDGAATTYAKRFALCGALNIIVEQDTDARTLGEYITPEQSANLRDRCVAANVDIVRFLKFAGAESFETIMNSRYAVSEAMLSKKEKEAVK
jgi:hypothetical protein